MTLNLFVIFLYLLSALLGSIPFAVVVGKVFFGTDVRKVGSGNPGATNTLRVLGKKAGLAVLLLDMAKGAIPVWLAAYFTHSKSGEYIIPVVCAALAVLGHVYSPFLKFKGGKGVATSIGVVIALQPIAALVMILTFIVLVYLTRYVSLGSIIGALIYPVYNLIFFRPFSPVMVFFSIGLAALVLFRHKANIGRLLRGEESKFGKPSTTAI